MVYRLKLNQLKKNQEALILRINPDSPVFQRVTDLGFSKGSKIKCVEKRKGTSAFFIKGTVVALRDEDSENILVLVSENDE